jgi:hypothetical protein
MICRSCGTEIADKALICYRCGRATTDPVHKPAIVPGRRVSTRAIALGVAVLAALAALVFLLLVS